MDPGLGFYIFVSSLVIDIRELFRVVQRIVRIKIIIGKLDVLIVKLGVFGEDIIDGRSTITYQLLICDEIFYDGDDFLDLRVLDDFRTLSFFHNIHGLAQDFKLFFIVGQAVVAAAVAATLVLTRHLKYFLLYNTNIIC